MAQISRHAFTLIELSIVLVIIGLIAGGIMVGRDLIEAAKIRGQISQVEKLNTAVYTFKGKYNCLPGDCTNAIALGLGTNASWENGNGDGMVDAPCFTAFANSNRAYNRNSNNFAHQLAAAGLIEGQYGTYSGEGHATYLGRDKFKERFIAGIFNETVLVPSYFGQSGPCYDASYDSANAVKMRHGDNGWALIGLPPTTADYFTIKFTGKQVRQMDEKIDDGAPLTGIVGVQFSTTFAVNASAITGACAAATSYIEANNCNPVFLKQY